MKILTLSLKRKFFDQILAGEKTHEYREIRPSSEDKYIRYVPVNYEDPTPVKGSELDNLPDDVQVDIEPIKYDAIKFLTGAYTGKRPYMIVEVKGAFVTLFTDEEGNDIVLTDSKGNEYIASEIDYTLGKILEVNENPE